MKLLEGAKILLNKKNAIREFLNSENDSNIPGLGIIIREDDYGSLQYAKQLIKDCEYTGIKCVSENINSNTDINVIFNIIDTFNENESITSILLQFPLPENLKEYEKEIVNRIDSRKIIDAPFWKMDLSREDTWPGTPYGIYLLLKYYDIDIRGKLITVIGRSKTVGTPLSLILTHNDATVTTCHSMTGINNIREYCKNADIVISAAGCPNLIDDSFELNDRQIIIDVGCNSVDGKLCGDVYFDRVAEKVDAITPVPGGVGPMTRAAILTQIMIKE